MERHGGKLAPQGAINASSLEGLSHERDTPREEERSFVANPIDLSGDVIAGASALAGLFLVYLGNVASAFGTFDKAAQSSVRSKFQLRAWLAFVGIVFSIISAILALMAKLWASSFMAGDAIILLIIALGWGAGIAFVAVKDVR